MELENRGSTWPCHCIRHLRLSSLRDAYVSVCEYFNQNGWEILCQHFEDHRVLTKDDVVAVICASRCTTAGQMQEIVLRLEKKINMTIEMFLRHINDALSKAHYSVIVTLLMQLHTPNCQLMLSQAMTMPQTPYYLPMPPVLVSPWDTIGRNINHTSVHFDVFATSLQPNSGNNLSDPYSPHLHVTKHPIDSIVSLGDELILRCLAESGEAISYTWEKNGRPLPGMNGKILIIPDAKPSDAGVYQCVVQTDCLREKSKVARVTIRTDCCSTCASSNSSSQSSTKNSLYFATEKFALLIANERYTHNPHLASASNDVQALAATLRSKLGFKTLALVNLNLPEMEKAVKLFCQQLVDGAYCVTYLAGHGFENDGQCYIVPTDAPIGYSAENCFSVKKLIHDIQTSCDLNLSVFLLDVCRRRNKNAVRVPEPDNSIRKSGNFVISFATMEHGMAYEVKGHNLGVYVASLQKYLDKHKRVTRVLELVHRDIHKNWFFKRGIQQPEFKSNMFEDRKLTDPIAPSQGDQEAALIASKWNLIHAALKPTLFIFESCGVKVELHKNCPFSNTISIEAKVVKEGLAKVCNVSIALRRPHSTSNLRTTDNHATSNRTRFEIENLQRLFGDVLYFTIFLKYELESNETIFQEKWDDSITVPFVSWWNS